MRRKTITPEMILEATIAFSAQYGLENVTTKKVAESIQISEGSIFNNFPNKKALLSECLYYIDRQIDPVLKDVPINPLNPSKMVKDLWYAYFSFLTAHRDYSQYYRQYRQSGYYTKDIIAGQNKSFSFFGNFLRNNKNLFHINTDFYWVFLIETTLNFAVRVADGDLPGTPKDIEKIYGLISRGVLGSMILPPPQEIDK